VLIGYYDNDLVKVFTNTSIEISELGSGLPTNCYTFQIDTDPWSTWGAANNHDFNSVSNGISTLRVIVRDKVGNNGSTETTIVTVDTTAPNEYGFFLSLTSATYNNVTWELEFNTEKNDHFNMTIIDNGTIGPSGFWNISWDLQGVFETPENESIGSLPRTKTFNYFGDTNGTFIVRLINNAGNFQEWVINATVGIRDVTIQIIFSDIVFNSPFIFHDGLSDYAYYSDNMGDIPYNITINGTASTTGGGSMDQVIQDALFGGNPSNAGNETHWSFTYSITQTDSGNGTFTVRFTAFDDLAKTGNETFEFRFDNTAPIVTHNPALTFESSSYLYYDGSSAYGYYSDNMGSSKQSFYISGGVTELGSGIATITDNTTFGNDPLRGGSGSLWQFEYKISDIDAGNGTFTITYNATDHVGNFDDTVNFEFREDNTDPTISHNAGGTSESSSYLYYDGVSTFGYYSDNMGGTTNNFIVAGGANDIGAGLSIIVDDTSFGNNPNRGGTLTSWTFTYAIDSGDSGNGTVFITYTALDNVNNSDIVTFEFREDNIIPNLSTPLVEDSSNSPYVYINGTFFFFSNLMGGNGVNINISGSITDDISGSGYYSVSYTSHFGDSPEIQYNTPSWSANYTINGTDPEQLAGITPIIINGTDNVGNWNTTTVTFQKDNTNPSVSLISLLEGNQSQYLHQINSSFIWYSTQGAGNRTFTVTILAQDSLSSISYSSYPDLFLSDGNDNSSTVNGTIYSRYWDWIYTIPDSASGSISRTIAVYDQCGNNATIDFNVAEDTIVPDVSMQTVLETSNYLFYNGSTLYYSNDNSGMDEMFEIRVLTSDGESGTDSESALVTATGFGETNSSSNDTIGYYSLFFFINEGEDNITLLITAYDNTGNFNSTTLNLIIDNTPPASLNITDVLNTTQYLYYDNGNEILYYSSNQTMFADFTIFLSAIDSDVGLSHAVGEEEFGETNINDFTPADDFELIYQINVNEEVLDGNVTVWVYDLVSNNASINLRCILDDTAPTILTIDTIIVEGLHLYFNVSQGRLFYSNDQQMLNNFTIYVEAFDLGVGLMEAQGENDFNNSNIVDSTYSTQYELSYSISQSDFASDDIIEISVYDLCGNIGLYNLDASMDNIGPRDITISAVNDFGSSFIHLYNGSSLILYVSNKSTVIEQFSLLISDSEPSNESGRLNATSESYFGEAPGTTTYQYFLLYSINPSEIIPNGTLIIHTFDRVSNYNSVNITIFVDLTSPRLVTGPFYTEDSDYLDTNGTHFFFSDNMPSTQTLTVFGTASDQLTGSGVDRIMYATAFGSSPATDFSSSWSADYGIDASDNENGTSSFFYVTILDRVNNSYPIPVYYISDNIAPSGLAIFDITEDLLAEYLHYVSGLTTLYYSNVRPDRGSRKFTIKVTAEDYGGAGLRNASFPNIGTGFSLGGYDTNYAIDLWNYTYYYDGSSGSANGSFTITIFDTVANSNTTHFDLFQDLNNPHSLAFSDLLEDSYYLYYDSGSTTFYYSNLSSNSELFTLKITAIDDESGLFSANGSLDFGEKHNTTPSGGVFSLTYSVDKGDSVSDNDLAVTVHDLTGNSAIFHFQCVLDITPPVNLNIFNVVENSEHLYYNSSTKVFFLSNDQIMSDSFTIQINADDFGAGLVNATGETGEFNDSNIFDMTYSTFYELIYSIEKGDIATNDAVTIWVYDKVGNNASIDLMVFIDNFAPLFTINNIIESSEYLYFNDSVLYYSNNKPGMSEPFTIRITSTDPNTTHAGLLKATGENEFGNTNVEDTIYSTYYELNYIIDQSEEATGSILTVWVFDRTGNNNSLNISCVLDNDAPSLVLLSTPIETDSSNYLFFDSTNTILYFSSNQPMADLFEIKLKVFEYISGVQNVTGSTDFGETPSTTTNLTTGTFDLQYIINQSETAGIDDQIIVSAYDNVGNVNSSFTLSAILDDTPPTNVNIEDILENSDLIYYSGTTVYYSNWHSGQAVSFQINVTCEDLGSGLLSANGSTDFGETPNIDDYSPGYYLLEYVIDKDDTASGNQITVSIYDKVRNVDSVTLNLINDNTPPESLNIESIIESSEFLYYNSSMKTLFFSNDQNMNSNFTVRVSGVDNGAGLFNATGEEGEYNNSGVFDTTYSTFYELIWLISRSDVVTDDAITIRLYDRVGNNATIDLPCIKDNLEPSGTIITVSESSPYLFYNSTSFILYYSNDQGMSDILTIYANSSDLGVGRLNATGENEFNDTNVGDVLYSAFYELVYQVDQNDIVQDGEISIYLYDLVGNYRILNLTCVEDNQAPISGTIESVQLVGVSYYLYYDIPGELLYYNNQNTMSDSFRVNITALDVNAGLKSVNGSFDFNEQHSSADYSQERFSLVYTISASEIASDNEIQFLLYDQVGNSAIVTLNCFEDNDKPTLVTIVDVVGPTQSDFLHYAGGVLFYSNTAPSMHESFTIRVSGTDAGSGRLNATGEDDFGETGIYDSTYSTYYELTYFVDPTDIASLNTISIAFFDRVGNFETVYLTCTIDNTAPSGIAIAFVGENAENLFYNSSLGRLFYSNDHGVDSSFYILISATDSTGVGLKNATGEGDFSDVPPVDTSYVGSYNISYTVSDAEIASLDEIDITIYDLVGNFAPTSLNCTLDNDAPSLTITSPSPRDWYNTIGGYRFYEGTVIDNGGSFKSGLISSNFLYSNNSGSTKSSFNSTLLGTTWSENDEIAFVNDANVTMIIYAHDMVGNEISQSVEIWHDDTPPSIDYNQIISSPGEPLSAGATTVNFYIPQKETSTYFDIDFVVNFESFSFYSLLTKAEYRTDDGNATNDGWYVIFDNTILSDYTTDWQIGDWASRLFNGKNSIDLRVTDKAGNILTHTFVSGVSGFEFLVDKDGPISQYIAAFGDESTVSNSVLYDHDGADFNISFSFSSQTPLRYVYVKSDDNQIGTRLTVGVDIFVFETGVGTQIWNASPQLISYDIGDTSNHTIEIRVENQADFNSSWIPVYLFVDEDIPEVNFLNIAEINNTWTIHASGNNLYYSTNMGANNAYFNVTALATDVGSGATTSDISFLPFESIDWQNNTATGVFYVNQFTSPGDPWIKVRVVDASGWINSSVNIVLTIQDTEDPSGLTIASVDESGENLFYNDTTEILYYSNDNPGMSDTFTIKLTALETISGIHNVTGSIDFDGIKVTFSNASGSFDLQYTVENGGSASGETIQLTVYDNTGNSDNITLECILDNASPTSLDIIDVTGWLSSEFLYYNSSTETLYYNNQIPAMNDSFTIQLTALEYLSGIQNVTGSYDFAETRSTTTNLTTGTFDLEYYVAQGEIASGNSITLTIYDMVGNLGTINLPCILDTDKPILPDIIAVIESSEYLHYDTGTEMFYISNDESSMNESFTVNVIGDDIGSGLQKANASEFGSTPETNDYDSGYYSLEFLVNENETAPTFNILIWDRVGNFITISLTIIIDNDAPSVPNIFQIDEDSEYIYYSAPNLYYTNNKLNMNESFTIRLTTSDTSSGRQNITGEDDFGDSGVFDLTYSTEYLLTYTIEINDFAQGDQIDIIVYDMVGNSAFTTLLCEQDNTPPSVPVIKFVNESSNYLFYDGSFYYSNNKPGMDEMVLIQLSSSDIGGSGLLNATGESHFGGEIPSDLIYSNEYLLSYNINFDEVANDENLTIFVFDKVGNMILIDIPAYLDNIAPSIDLQDTAITESSNYLYYPADGTQILWYSNNMPSGVPFTVTVDSDDDGPSDSGVLSMEFPDILNHSSPVVDTISPYSDSYSIDSLSNFAGNMIFVTVDNCGNNNSISLEIRRDNQEPTGEIISVFESSPYLHSENNNTVWYSDLMGATSEDLIITINATDKKIVDSGIFKVEFPSIGDDSSGDLFSLTSNFVITYNISDSDTTSTSVSFNVTDNVGNKQSVDLLVIRDLIDPIISNIDVTNPIYDLLPYDETDGIGNWYDPAELISGFSLTSIPDDFPNGPHPKSGIYDVVLDWDSTVDFDDNFTISMGPDGDIVISDLLDDSDGDITLTLTVYDRTGNMNSVSFTIRFDRSDPNYVDSTILHQNGRSITLAGQATDSRSGIQNITITDLNGDHFSSLILSDFDDWHLTNDSDLSDLVPGTNDTILIRVYDNCNNFDEYYVNITYHTLIFYLLESNIPKHVEIDHPGNWNIALGIKLDGDEINDTEVIIDRFVNSSQFNVWLNGTTLALGQLNWISGATNFSLPVLLPDSSTLPDANLTIGDLYPKDIQVRWAVESSTINVSINEIASKKVSYHDLEISYVYDDLDRTETNNPDILNITLNFAYDSQFMSNNIGSGLAASNMLFTIGGKIASVVNITSAPQNGDYWFQIQMPANLSTGLHNIAFAWRFDDSPVEDYYYTYENGSEPDIIRYHDIQILVSIPDNQRLFEVDGDFSFTVNFSISEDDGITGLQPLNSISDPDLFFLEVNGVDMSINRSSLLPLGNGSYSFTFNLYGHITNPNGNWIGNRTIQFWIISPTGLFDLGRTFIIGHDLKLTILDIKTYPTGLLSFDPNEKTSFEMQISVEDDNGTSGYTPVSNLLKTDLKNMTMVNLGFPDQYITLSTIDFITLTPNGDEYKFRFDLQAIDATTLGTGFIGINLTLSDHNGHFTTNLVLNQQLESRDFVTLLGLRWISTSYGNFSFSENNSGLWEHFINATTGITFRVSLNSEINISFWVYAQENPFRTPKEENVTVVWNTPTIQSLANQQRFVTITLNSSQAIRRLFIAYVDGNEEEQNRISPWRIHLEWNEIIADPQETDDHPDDTVNSILNVDGTYNLDYSTSYNQSNLPASGSLYSINLTIYDFNGLQWILNDSLVFQHLDGSGDIDFLLPFGVVSIKDLISPSINNADGRINISLSFTKITRVDLDVRVINETGSLPYRNYTSLSTYPGRVFSAISAVSGSIFHETLIWTKLKVNMWAPDDRVSFQTNATIHIEAFYAHNTSIPLDGVRVIIRDDSSGAPSSSLFSGNRVNFYDPIHASVESVKFNITRFENSLSGITLFEEMSTNDTDVSIEIIWDQVKFFLSFPAPWNDSIRFDVGSPAFIYIEGYYLYDSEPFNGTVELYHRTTSLVNLTENETLVVITPEMVNSLENDTDTALFMINRIISDKYGLTSHIVTKKYETESTISDFLLINWDRIIIEFDYEIIGDTDRTDVVPGDLVNVSLNAWYQSDEKPINSLEHTLLRDGELFYEVNRTLPFFDDSEIFITSHTYRVINVYDPNSHLNEAYSLMNESAIPSVVLTVYWEDRFHAPQILEPKLIDYGNGTLGFAIITTDDNLEGLYYGSGVKNVSVQLQIEGVPGGQWSSIWELDKISEEPFGSANISYFFRTVKTDPNNIIDFFRYNQSIRYRFTLVDRNGNEEEVELTSVLLYDNDAPLISSFNLEFSEEIDGNIDITIFASDNWSGVSNSSTIQFYNALLEEWESPQYLNYSETDENSAVLVYSTLFTVGDSIAYRLSIFDRFGKVNMTEGIFEVSDFAGPQLIGGEFSYIDFGVFSLNITIGDNGSEIKSATLYYKIAAEWVPVNLTEVLSADGSGSSVSSAGTYKNNKIFVEKFSITPSLLDLREIQFLLILEDDAGNRRPYDNEDLARLLVLDFTLVQNGFNMPPILADFIKIPFVLPIIILLLLGLVVVTVRRFRTISGFDKKRIMEAMKEISENEVWEENDKISVGLIINHFEQTRGPIPIIYYPEKLSISETMAFSLADRSFSTLGFVGDPEDDNHATFRFQIGGEKSTVFGYSFAKKDPEARGGQENNSLIFIIHHPWGNLDNLNRFLAELLEYSRRIRSLVLNNADVKIVQKEMEIMRNFFTRAMLTFRQKYRKEFVDK
jgi:hypothetical protein